jgi:hypothetical protein
VTTKSQAVAAVLNRLRGALGTGESPDGSNHNFITEWYNANVDRIGNGPWCEMTVTWAMWTGGAKSLKRGRAYTVYGAEDGIHHSDGSSWHSGTEGMQAGDQIYYDWSGSRNPANVDHTGICEKVNGNGTFYALEGNAGNHLQRTLRDSKYVAGYVRFDWARLEHIPAAPHQDPHPVAKPVSHSTANRPLTMSIQHWLKVSPDGLWGPATDNMATLMRTAARAHAGYPHNAPHTFGVKTVQGIVGTKIDGIWGPKTQAALVRWIRKFQQTLVVGVDGKWGPRTDNAFLTIRKHNLNNF